MSEAEKINTGVFFQYRNEKELELVVWERSLLFHASLKESYDSKTKKAIDGVVSQLNHFLAHLDKEDNGGDIRNQGEGDLSYVIIKFMNLKSKLERNEMNKIARRRSEENRTSFKEEKINYFKDVIRDKIIEDDYLRKLISDYCYKYLKKNLEPSNIDQKLYYSDVHIYQCLSVYSKILYLLYFEVSELIGYKSLMKSIIIELSELINDLCPDLFPEEYNIAKNRTFMDRMFSYIEFQNTKNSKDHQRLIKKFAAIGYSHEYITIEMLKSILSSLKSFGPVTFEKTGSSHQSFNIKENNPEKWGYVAKSTVSWISKITRNTMVYLSKYTTNFVISSVYIDDENQDPEETPESSKYEILLEKIDRENYEDMQNIKEFIVEETKKKLSDKSKKKVKQLVEQKTDITHLYNKFMVSLFLEQEYNINLVHLLTYPEYLYLVFRVHERFEGDLDMKYALISPEADVLNGVRIREKDMDGFKFYHYCNDKRTPKIINKIIGRSYAYKDDNGDIRYLKLKKGFIKFIERGMVL